MKQTPESILKSAIGFARVDHLNAAVIPGEKLEFFAYAEGEKIDEESDSGLRGFRNAD